MSTVVKNAAIRAIRTFFQSAIPVYLLGLANASDLTSLVSPTLLQTAALAGIIAALSFAMNVLEGSSGQTYNKG
jgi:hypothetical protein